MHLLNCRIWRFWLPSVLQFEGGKDGILYYEKTKESLFHTFPNISALLLKKEKKLYNLVQGCQTRDPWDGCVMRWPRLGPV